MTLGLDALLRDVSAEYEALPVMSAQPMARVCYDKLCAELLAQFGVLRMLTHVSFSEQDPYPNSDAMFADISQRGRLSVYTGGATLPIGHPFARRIEPLGQTFNDVFRAVHGGLAHYPIHAGFGPVGETRAFLAHAHLLSSPATHALATETIGQNAYYYVHGTYAPQKFALLRPSTVFRALAVAEGIDAAVIAAKANHVTR